jgi:hypothetical protein
MICSYQPTMITDTISPLSIRMEQNKHMKNLSDKSPLATMTFFRPFLHKFIETDRRLNIVVKTTLQRKNPFNTASGDGNSEF